MDIGMPHRISAKGLSAAELSKLVDGEVIGNPNRIAFEIAPLDNATTDTVTFIKEKSPRRVQELVNESSASIYFVVKDLVLPTFEGKTLILVDDPLAATVLCVPAFYESDEISTGIHPTAVIDDRASIAKSAKIGAYCVIGSGVTVGEETVIHPHTVVYPHAKIGAQVTIHSHVVIREECIVGDHCVIQNGAVIGSDGFGYIPDKKLGLKPVPQVGIVKLGDRVDIGANACIDRATFGETIIGAGSKVDNLVQVGHNTKIGKFSILCGQTGVAGSCEIGNNVVLGGNSGVSDHIKIVDNARFAAKSGVIFDITEKGDYGGHPAIPMQRWRRVVTLLNKLPEIFKQAKESEKGR